MTQFLNLEWHTSQGDIAAHAKNKVVYSPTYADVVKPIYRSSIGRWKNYQDKLEPFREKLEPFVEAFGYD